MAGTFLLEWEVPNDHIFHPAHLQMIGERLGHGLLHVAQNPEVWDDPTTIRVTLVDPEDAYPDGIHPVHDAGKHISVNGKCLFVFFDEYYVHADGSVRFE